MIDYADRADRLHHCRPWSRIRTALYVLGGAVLVGVALGLLMLAVVIVPQLDWTVAREYLARMW